MHLVGHFHNCITMHRYMNLKFTFFKLSFLSLNIFHNSIIKILLLFWTLSIVVRFCKRRNSGIFIFGLMVQWLTEPHSTAPNWVHNFPDFTADTKSRFEFRKLVLWKFRTINDAKIIVKRNHLFSTYKGKYGHTCHPYSHQAHEYTDRLSSK